MNKSLHKQSSIYLLTLLVLLTTFSSSAQNFVYKGVNYTITNEYNKTCKTREGWYDYIGSFYFGNNLSGNVIIPSEVIYKGETYTVTEIGKMSFRYTKLTSIEIPNSIKSIGTEAFEGCINLISINIPNSVTEIGNSAFHQCEKLAAIKIPDSVTEIGNMTFQDCFNMTSIDIPNTIRSIGSNAFWCCSSLTSINIPNSITSIGIGAFNYCKNLTEINYNTTSPIIAYKDIFDDNTYQKAILNIAVGGLDKAYGTEPWMYFMNIKEKDFTSGIEDVITDFDLNMPIEVYNLNGIKVADAVNNLPAGIYLIRQGHKTQKIFVK